VCLCVSLYVPLVTKGLIQRQSLLAQCIYVFRMVIRRVIVPSYCGDPEFNARPHRNRMGVFGLHCTGLGHEPGADSCLHDGKPSGSVRGCAEHIIQIIVPGVYFVLKVTVLAGIIV
jgi:hypothetical protein